MSDKITTTPEGRFAEMLTMAAKEGFDLNEVIQQIPEAERPKVHAVLSGLAEQTASAKGGSAFGGKAPVAPIVKVTTTAEAKALIESLKLEEGFAKALETQRAFQLLREGERAPDFGQVMKTFTPEMLAAAQTFQNPTLILSTKGRSFNDLVSVMDGHNTIEGQEDVYVDEIYRNHADRKPENWGGYIVEGTRETDLHDFDDTSLTLRDRLRRFADHKKTNGVSGMDRFKYTQLMLQTLKDGEPIDHNYTWTILDGDPALSDSRVLNAAWDPGDDHFVLFDWPHPGDAYDYYRFRRSVGGDVQNS